MDDVKNLKKIDDPAAQLPFIGETLGAIRSTIDDETALIGFIGTPWTLAAYAMEGAAEKNCRVTKVRLRRRITSRTDVQRHRAADDAPALMILLQTMMMNNPEVLHAFLEHLTESLIVYLSHQIDSGAQVSVFPPSLRAGRKHKP